MSYVDQAAVIESTFKAAWVDLNGAALTPVFTDDVPGLQTSDQPWARISAIPGVEKPANIGAVGSNYTNFRNTLIISINVYVPATVGNAQAWNLAEIAAVIFRGTQIAAGNGWITCRGTTLRNLGMSSENFFGVNVSVDAYCDTFR